MNRIVLIIAVLVAVCFAILASPDSCYEAEADLACLSVPK